MKHRLTSILAATLVIAASSPRAAAAAGKPDEPTPIGATIDAIVVRPVGVVVLAAGAVILVAALPFAAIARNVPKTADVLVGNPARVIYGRPLGDFRAMRDDALGHHPRS